MLKSYLVTGYIGGKPESRIYPAYSEAQAQMEAFRDGFSQITITEM